MSESVPMGTSLMPGTAYVVGSDAPASIILQARILKARFGNLVQICDGITDNVEIQAAIDALTPGRTRQETVKMVGTFTVASTIYPSSYTILDLTDARLTLANSANCDMISDPTGGASYVTILGGHLDGNKANNTSGSGIVGDTAVSNVDSYWKILRTVIRNFKQDAVHIAALNANNWDIAFCSIGSNDGYGVYGHTNLDALIHISHCDISTNGVCNVALLSGQLHTIDYTFLEGTGSSGSLQVSTVYYSDFSHLTFQSATASLDQLIALSGAYNSASHWSINNCNGYSKIIWLGGSGWSLTDIQGDSNDLSGTLHTFILVDGDFNSLLGTKAWRNTSGYKVIFINSGADGTLVSDSNIYDNPGAVAIYDIGTHTSILNNKMKDCGGGISSGLGLIMGNTIENMTVWPTDFAAAVRAYNQFSDLFMDVLAVSATHVRSNEDLSEAIPNTFTLDAQPDIPRTLSGHFDAHGNITAYTIVITGVDAKGNTITETKTEADGWDWETNNAFATITSIIMTARTGTGVGDTMDIGITDVLGLSNKIYSTSDVYKIKKSNANAVVATAQVNATYNTYDMAVIGLAGGDDFTIWFRSNLNVLA